MLIQLPKIAETPNAETPKPLDGQDKSVNQQLPESVDDSCRVYQYLFISDLTTKITETPVLPDTRELPETMVGECIIHHQCLSTIDTTIETEKSFTSCKSAMEYNSKCSHEALSSPLDSPPCPWHLRRVYSTIVPDNRVENSEPPRKLLCTNRDMFGKTAVPYTG